MPGKSKSYTIFEKGWILRVQPPESRENGRIMILVHGWTGDEQSMNIFSRGISEKYWLLFPRGPIETGRGGYGWVKMDTEPPPGVAEYQEAARRLARQIDIWCQDLKLPETSINLMGFSQGAAVILTMALLFPDRYDRIASLAGYLPRDASKAIKPNVLQEKTVYVAHGAKDDIVPVERARETVKFLKLAGAEVHYCEEDVGHKLSKSCFDGLTSYFLSGLS